MTAGDFSAASLGRLGVHTIVLRLTPFISLFALATSALLLALRHPDQGRIALPSAADNDEAEHDPFDQVDPEVWEDGVPLADDAFWRRTQLLGRLPLLSLSLAALAVRSALFVLPVIAGNRSTTLPLLADLVAIALYVWLVVLTCSSLPLRDVPTHWRTLLHQASLLGAVTACRMLELLLPADAADEASPYDDVTLRILRYAELGCLTVRPLGLPYILIPQMCLTLCPPVRSSRRP